MYLTAIAKPVSNVPAVERPAALEFKDSYEQSRFDALAASAMRSADEGIGLFMWQRQVFAAIEVDAGKQGDLKVAAVPLAEILSPGRPQDLSFRLQNWAREWSAANNLDYAPDGQTSLALTP